MNTFLPYPDFEASARCLDRARLGKQRVEVVQLLKALLGLTDGWRNHPAARMWRGYEACLVEYGFAICDEWTRRGYRDTCRDTITDLMLYGDFNKSENPPWLGGPIHESHRSNLLRKDPEHYGQFGWSELPTLPYVWPE